LTPSNWHSAFSSLEKSSPVSPAVTITLAVAVAVMIVVALGGTVWSCWVGGQRFDWGQLRQTPTAPVADEGVRVTTFASASAAEDERHVGYGDTERA
jgi:hypothetical protein